MDAQNRIKEFSYQHATKVTCDDDGPASGETTFRGVPYTFTRTPEDHPHANEWGVWYDLNPIDADTGLPMRAMGHFRSPDSVRWTSMGSPSLNDTCEIRSQFQAFIKRLIDETATYAHWDAFCVAHFRDDLVEEVRRDCVRLFLNRETLKALTPKEVDKLMSLSHRLTHDNSG